MKKIFITLGLAVLLFVPLAVFAQESLLSSPGMTPDSPFYILDLIGEKIGEFFAFSAEGKARHALASAEERLAEAEAMADKGKDDLAATARERYQERLNAALAKAAQAKEQGKDVEEVMALVAEATFRHIAVLTERLEQVPEQAQGAIAEAIEVSSRGNEESLNALSGEKKQEVIEEAKGKIPNFEERIPEDVRDKLPGAEEGGQPTETPDGQPTETPGGQPKTISYQSVISKLLAIAAAQESIIQIMSEVKPV